MSRLIANNTKKCFQLFNYNNCNKKGLCSNVGTRNILSFGFGRGLTDGLTTSKFRTSPFVLTCVKNVNNTNTCFISDSTKYKEKEMSELSQNSKNANDDVRDVGQTTVDDKKANPTLSQRERLKLAIRDYGSTVIVFHVTISLMSLGICYMAVSSGLDVVAWLSWLGVGKSLLESKLATGASTFVVSYAVHKVFAPVRIACTLTATPFIVKYLRRIGFLKTKKTN